jgi:molecular chaperone DnaK (HSP70)
MTMAMDFGTSNTVLARWNAALGEVEVLRLPGVGRVFEHRLPRDPTRHHAPVAPSIIHYGESGSVLLGAQVTEAGLSDHVGTFRWLKLDMLKGQGIRSRRVNGSLIPVRQAAEDLVRSILAFGLGQSGGEERELVLTVPVEAFDPYMNWLSEVAGRVFPGTIRMIDEATACILGYEHMVREDEVYIVFDFGGGTLDVSVVKVLLGGEGTQKCRILGRAGEELGGTLVDRWMLEHLTSRGAFTEEDLRDVGTRLVALLEDAKIAISSGADEADVSWFNDRTGRFLSSTISRADLRKLLDAKELPRLVARTIDRALDMAQEKYGVRKAQVRGVFMVGGSSLLLGVADSVRALFPDAPVRCDRPFDAIVAGACRYAGEDLNPTLVHDYGMRSWNTARKEFEWVTLIPRGTQYPTPKAILAKYVTAAARESETLGLVIIERSAMAMPSGVWEVGADGRLRRTEQAGEVVATERELNPQGRTFIRADPPCTADEARRFYVAFGIDPQKRMIVSVRDTKAGNRSYVQTAGGERLPLPLKDCPLVKL